MFFIKVINLIFLLTGIGLVLAASGCSETRSTSDTSKKLIVLAFDGMDPTILNGLIREGKLTNFERLMKTGDFKPLRTSVPPQSPVAWSSFITGMNPGGHGIFDFIHRDPDTMFPYLSTSKTLPPAKTITIGEWIIPLSSGKVKLLR